MESSWHRTVLNNRWTWFVAIAILGIIVAWAVGIAVTTGTSSYNPYGTSRQDQPNSIPPHGNAAIHGPPTQKRSQCVTGEFYDEKLRLCAPIVHFPTAVDNSIMDRNVTACNSFYQHSCGIWRREHTNQNRAFSYVYRKNMYQLHELVAKAKAKTPMNSLYASCVQDRLSNSYQHETRLERAHMKKLILGPGHARSHRDLPVIFGRLAKWGFVSPLSMSIERHPTKPRMVPLFLWDGIDEEQVNIRDLLMEEKGAELTRRDLWDVQVREKRITRVVRGLRAQVTRPNDVIGNYAEYVYSREFSGDMMSWYSFESRAGPDWSWKGYFNGLGHPMFDSSDSAWVIDHHYYEWLTTDGLRAFTVDEWRAYIEFCLLYEAHNFMPRLPEDVYLRSRLMENPFKHMEHRLPRSNTTIATDEKCVHVTQYLLPGVVAKAFLSQHFHNAEELRQNISTLVHELRDAYAELIRRTPWMDTATRHASLRKIRSIIVRAVHPNSWRAEPFATRLSPDRWLHNLNLIRRYRVQQNLVLWKGPGGPLHRDAFARFGAPLSTVNAFYSPTSNTITVFAGILRAPFFHPRYNDLSIRARLGSIIGHELSHALDNHGRLYDATGSLPRKGWWSKQSIANFRARAQCIVDEYGPPQGCQIAQYGMKTLSEDIADLVGMRMAYMSYFGKYTFKLTPLQRRTHEQWFFASFAQIWCASYTQEQMCKIVKNDVHALPWFRVDRTLRQMPEFAAAFGCSQRDPMVAVKPCVMYGG
jgi:predicted metalloendopeptidase